jgi:hypothetical protein
MQSDQRKSPRISSAFNVELSLPDQVTVKTKTRDISQGGAFVIIKEQDITPEIHMTLTIRVLGLPTGPGDPVQCQVVRLEDEGLGLRFIQKEEE